MKWKKFLILSGIIAIILFACDTPVKNKKETNSFLTATNGIELDSRLNSADSLVFVFYKDPYSKDSLRYTRFYTQYATTDTGNISLLLHNLEVPFTKLEKIRNCRSEGKIWCYAKGKIFQTVYFSTRCDECCFIYIIKDGYFFYMKLDKPLFERLSVLHSLSSEIKEQ